MGLGIGALGFLAGAGQAVGNRYEQEYLSKEKEKDREANVEMAQINANLQLRNDQAMAMLNSGLQKDIAQFTHGFDMEKLKKQYEYQGTNQTDLAKLNADLQAGLISVEAAHQLATSSFSAQLNNQLQIARDNNSFNLEKDLIKIRDDYAKGQLGLQHSYNLSVRAYEHQLAKAKTQEERDWLNGEITRLNGLAEQAAKLGNPFVLPAGFQGYNFGNKPSGIAGMGTQAGQLNLTEGVDTDGSIFFYTDKNGNSTYVPAVDTDVRTKVPDQINQKYVNVLASIGPELWWHIENNSPVLDKIKTNLVANVNKAELRKSIELQQGANAQGLAIQNPVKAFELMSFIKRDGQADPASLEWFAQNILGPSLGMSEEAIRYAVGMPPEVELGYDRSRDTFLVPPASSYQWATSFEFNGSGKATLKSEIKEEALTLARESNLPVGVVLSTFGKFDNPTQAIKATYEDRATMRSLLDSDGYPTQAFNETMSRKIRDNGLSPQEGIALIRTYLNDNPYRMAQSFIIEGDVAKPQFNKQMKDLYGLDREQARAKAVAAKSSIRIATQMLDIRRQFAGVKAGRIGDVRLALAGMGELVQDFRVLMRQMSDINGFDPSMDPTGRIYANMDTINGLEAELINLAENPELTDINRLQSVFNMLGETLAYNQAAVAQGGAQGRDISDNDVRNWKRKLGFEGTFIYTPGVEANLENLIYENEQISQMYGAYANAKTETDFRAVFMYDEAVGILPMDYSTWQDNAPNRYSGVEIDEGGLGRAGTATYTVNGQQRTFPLN